jgi:hypothetical protein
LVLFDKRGSLQNLSPKIFLKKIINYFLVEWKRSFNFARAFGGMIVCRGRESVRI